MINLINLLNSVVSIILVILLIFIFLEILLKVIKFLKNKIYYEYVARKDFINKEYHDYLDWIESLDKPINLNGEPIVCSPNDAIRTFFSCGLDSLIIEDFLINK